MPPIIGFIGWHNSGKTTLAAKVVRILRARGLRVAAIKSSGKTGALFDKAGSDTSVYKEAGADGVLFVAADQMVLQTTNDNLLPGELAERFFPDHDLVIAEGFKHAVGLPKIEVLREDGRMLAGLIAGVEAVVTSRDDVVCEHVFSPHDVEAIADYVVWRCRTRAESEHPATRLESVSIPPAKLSLIINGQAIPLKDWVQEALAGTVLGFVSALKKSEDAAGGDGELLLRIRLGGGK
ncbi:MAG: molybdopterin-guanine dinucleotide biosynthesis protein B [Desulfobulbaceae bacterium]|jgi:molybdopterin-guanine dinucleotide biosynthesis protein B|nr:molybdopterin-guanine dinucleotide biosynthesis protein B [Desulfobulbaceae bacterium]